MEVCNCQTLDVILPEHYLEILLRVANLFKYTVLSDIKYCLIIYIYSNEFTYIRTSKNVFLKCIDTFTTPLIFETMPPKYKIEDGSVIENKLIGTVPYANSPTQ